MSISRRCATGMLLAAPFIARAANAATFPAPGVWPSGSPASVGLNVAKLMEAQAYAQQYGGGAGCVIRNGLLVHSWGSLTQLYLVQSATKSFGSALLGFAVDDGKVDVTAPAQRYLPGIGAIPSTNTATGWLDDIRVDHLATHLGGFPKSRSPSALVAQPGTTFIHLQRWWHQLAGDPADQGLRPGSPDPGPITPVHPDRGARRPRPSGRPWTPSSR